MNYDAIPKANLHTHSVFSDGKNTPEEMLREALAHGFVTLGFSDHSQLECGKDWSLSEQGEKEYKAEIARLREVYKDRICVLLGIEQDILSVSSPFGWDYVIGSVHMIPKGGMYHPVDMDSEALKRAVNEFFGGDFYLFAKDYYALVAQLYQRTSCDIVGHFDLVTKFNEGNALFDENDPRYLKCAMEALDALMEKDVIFEINTGAISRGYRRTPYPAPIFLQRIAEKRGRVTFSSDCHRKEWLLTGHREALQYAKAAGLGSIAVRTHQGFEEFPL